MIMGIGSKKKIAWRRRGFTLTELLVVITIIVLVLGMSIPLVRTMSTDRSVESGQNLVSAMLQRARARAIGLQAPRGIFFFEDQSTGKTAMVLVKIDDGADPNVIELDEEAEDFQYLPMGVGAAFVLGRDQLTPDPTLSSYRPYGLVVFDGSGRIMTVPAWTTLLPKSLEPYYPGKVTRLYDRYRDFIGTNVMAELGTGASGQQVSQSVILLYDKVPFATLQAGTTYKFSKEQTEWLDNNGLALSVNRYNGTITRSE
jgi:prepilin-type N-terminal cleavage/methylation domain-containing protein